MSTRALAMPIGRMQTLQLLPSRNRCATLNRQSLDPHDHSLTEVVAHRQANEEYDKRALPPMLKWVKRRCQNRDRIVQYRELGAELQKYNPRYRSHIRFCKKVLLPALTTEMEDLPPSLIAVLCSIHLVRTIHSIITEIFVDGANMEFTAESYTILHGEIVTHYQYFVFYNFRSQNRKLVAKRRA
jgi:hypothetical protein